MAKSLENKLSQEDFQSVDLARRDLEREPSECYKGYVVRSRFKRVPNEAVKCNAFSREEEVRKFPFWYIELVKSPDGRMLGSNREIRDAFRAHFCDRFPCYPDLPVQEFRSYLTDLPHHGEAEAASCEGLVTECEAGRPQQIAETRRFTLLSALEAAAHVYAFSDGYVQPLVRPGSHPW